ncbi:MAG TPA: ClbS/DfsB family four-helix bundle protein [Anaerolineales bacterium]|nr:ClbS/DfsB family four-helix bundle protein [Anaerolineales bacterium]
MVEPKLPKNTAELLDDIDREWSALRVAVEKLSPAQLTTADSGGWSPKDNLAHLTEWMKILVGYHMDRRPSPEVTGLPLAVTQEWNFDVVNRLFFERNRDRSSRDVMDELERVYAGVVARLKSMPFEEVMQPRDPDDPEKRPLLGWILGNTSEHFAEHRSYIERALKK